MIPWIDNFLFGSDTPPVMESMQRRFAEVTHRVNIECKEEAMPYGHTMDAIGLHFDVSATDAMDHFVEVQAFFRDQMAKDLGLLAATMTPRQYFQVFGGCMWANYAVGAQPLCRWNHALDTLRRLAIAIHRSGSQATWDAPFDIPAAACTELMEMSNELQRTRRTLKSLEEPTPTTDIWTDASKWAWGFVRTFPGPLAGAHHPHEIKDIFVAELLAACDAWYTERHQVPNLNVDNTGAVGVLIKGHARTARGNLILGRLYEMLPPGAKARVTTLPTLSQRGDLCSRGVYAAGPPCDHAHVGGMQLCWGRGGSLSD